MNFQSLTTLKWCAAISMATLLAACDGGTTQTATDSSSAVQGVAPSPAATVESNSATDNSPVLTAQALESNVGNNPNLSTPNFLQEGTLAKRLQILLGSEMYPIFLANMAVAGPLTKEGELFYVTGNRVDQGGIEMAAVVADPAKNALKVWLVHDKKVHIFPNAEQADTSWPEGVQMMINNYQPTAIQQ